MLSPGSKALLQQHGLVVHSVKTLSKERNFVMEFGKYLQENSTQRIHKKSSFLSPESCFIKLFQPSPSSLTIMAPLAVSGVSEGYSLYQDAF